MSGWGGGPGGAPNRRLPTVCVTLSAIAHAVRLGGQRRGAASTEGCEACSLHDRSSRRRADTPVGTRQRDLAPIRGLRGPILRPFSSVRLEPRLGLVERTEVAADLELPVLAPDLGLVDLAVLGIQDGTALVAVSAEVEVLDDDEADDRLVLFGPLALGAGLRLSLRVVRLGEADDLAVELAALLVQLDLGGDLARLLVDCLPAAGWRIGPDARLRAHHEDNRHHDDRGHRDDHRASRSSPGRLHGRLLLSA